jgi:uncharacterized protein (UPF0147 family)
MTDLSAHIEEIKSLFQRVLQAKNNPQEIERIAAEAQKLLDKIAAEGQTGATGSTGSTGSTTYRR